MAPVRGFLYEPSEVVTQIAKSQCDFSARPLLSLYPGWSWRSASPGIASALAHATANTFEFVNFIHYQHGETNRLSPLGVCRLQELLPAQKLREPTLHGQPQAAG